MSPFATSICRSLRAKKPPKRLVSPSIDRQVLSVIASGMDNLSARASPVRYAIAREQAVGPHDHHHNKDDAVNDEALRVLEIKKAVEEVVDAVHGEEAGPFDRHQLEPIAQRSQQLRQQGQTGGADCGSPK